MQIDLSKEDIQRAVEFSNQVAATQQKIEFGQNDTKPRSRKEMEKDNFIGRLGEIAVQRMFDRFGMKVELDDSIYPRGQWDRDDIHIGDWSIDVKCTKMRGKYLLFDWNKLGFREDDHEVPHYLIMTRLLQTVNIDALPEYLPVEVCGYWDIRDFLEPSDAVEILRKGTNIPGTNSKLQADNYGVRIEHLRQDWGGFVQRLQEEKPFGFVKEGKLVEQPEKLTAMYSLILAGKTALSISSDRLEAWLRQGIKINIFLPESKCGSFQSLVENYGSANLFNCYSTSSEATDLCIADGAASAEDIQKLKKAAPVFNAEQYLIEHAPADAQLIVKASAGTGKTKVMIDRVLFLLSTVPGISPRDIGMITFTREAAQDMRGKIASRIVQLYQLSHRSLYLNWLEEISAMQISTTDSFFRRVITSQSADLGYGSGVSVRGLKYNRNEILRDVMDAQFHDNTAADFLQKIGIPLYKYQKLVSTCWEKLSSRGYYLPAVEKMDFGTAEGKSQTINKNLRDILVESERRYQQVKKEENAISLQDFNEEMDKLVTTESRLSELNLRYLFVDEFQDTDNSQIRTLAWLQRQLQCILFVVGDVKQSIYRFRGAEESAFQRLSEIIKDQNQVEMKECLLRRNYRTQPQILSVLNPLFKNMGSMGHLLWDGDVEADPMKNGQGKLELVFYGRKKAEKNSPRDQFIKTLQKMEKEQKIKREDQQKDSQRINCILTRSNRQVSEAASWCQEAKIPCIAVLDGGFFRTPPVRDMLHLLQAILYPEDARVLYGYLLTPYAENVPDIEQFEKADGVDGVSIRYLLDLAGESFQSLLYDARRKPFFQLIRETVERVDPSARFACRRKAELLLEGYTGESMETQLALDVESYRLNLHKLLEIFYESFSGEFISVLSVCDYLQVQMDTNDEEDALYEDEKKDGMYLTAMTVHKSKGLEFDTVMIPFTDQVFFSDIENQLQNSKSESKPKPKDRYNFLVQEEPLRLGWQAVVDGKLYQNDAYGREFEAEKDARIREEARILYVAMTRAMNKLYCFVPEKWKDNTWAALLDDGDFLRMQPEDGEKEEAKA